MQAKKKKTNKGAPKAAHPTEEFKPYASTYAATLARQVAAVLSPSRAVQKPKPHKKKRA